MGNPNIFHFEKITKSFGKDPIVCFRKNSRYIHCLYQIFPKIESLLTSKLPGGVNLAILGLFVFITIHMINYYFKIEAFEPRHLRKCMTL